MPGVRELRWPHCVKAPLFSESLSLKVCASFCQVALLISRIWSLSLSDHGELNSLHAFLYYFNERKVLLHLGWQQALVIVGLTCA